MQSCQFGHGFQVAFDLGQRHRAGIAGDVIGAGENDDDLWVEVDDVRTKANEHLRCGLPADAAVNVGLAGERLVELPDVGDGVAHEDDAVFVGVAQAKLGVGLTIAAEIAEIIHPLLDESLAILLKVLHGFDCFVAGLLGEYDCGEQGNCEEHRNGFARHLQNISPRFDAVSGDDVLAPRDAGHEATCCRSL